MKDILLITPPFTQLNTPYPATAYLKGFLNTKNIESHQSDLGIEVILRLFSREKLSDVFSLAAKKESISPNAERILALKDDYLKTIDNIIAFLQGKLPSYARQIAIEDFLPKASRFNQLDELDWAFGYMGFQDKAKHLATLYLEDLSDLIVECVDEDFGFSRYAEKIGRSANSFDEIYSKLQSELSYIDKITVELLEEKIKILKPKIVALSVPFPGNMLSAFRCAQHIKSKFPETKTIMGGGFPNTELRSLKEERVFEFFDFITLDDGELPIELLISKIISGTENISLKRTFCLENSKVVYKNESERTDYKQSDVGTADYSDLLLDKYISVIEITNPMHSLWSDGRWNKLTLAHGCYWAKCTFCDTSLDYIKNHEATNAKILVDRIEQIIEQTGENGFHFVDEAAPPALMKALALEILKRDLNISWWTNIRFEKNFSKDLCKLLSASGCIAVSGGLEVASDRLLKLINKGVSVEQVAQVTRNFSEANIMVHSYLMYGYPTQTVQETIDSLEMVRQLFQAGIIQSGFWHQFALTAHSDIGLNPDKYGITPILNEISYANNDVEFTDKTGIDHSKFGYGLKKSLFNYMHGVGFEFPLQDWFEFKIPKTKIPQHFIENILRVESHNSIKNNSKIVWLGPEVLREKFIKRKKNKTFEMLKLTFHFKNESINIDMDYNEGKWFTDFLKSARNNAKPYSKAKSEFEKEFYDFELFMYSKQVQKIREHLLIV